MIVTPMLLRSWVKAGHIKEGYMDGLREVFKEEIAEKGMGTIDQAIIDQITVDQIINCFALIAHGAAAVMAAFIPPKQQVTFDSTVINGIKAFQRLCEAAAISLDRRRGGSKTPQQSPSREATPQPPREPAGAPTQAPNFSQGGSTATEAVADVDKQGPAPARKPKAASDFRRWQALPNTHGGMHWKQVAEWYATPRNVIGLSGEDKHR